MAVYPHIHNLILSSLLCKEHVAISTLQTRKLKLSRAKIQILMGLTRVQGPLRYMLLKQSFTVPRIPRNLHEHHIEGQRHLERKVA